MSIDFLESVLFFAASLDTLRQTEEIVLLFLRSRLERIGRTRGASDHVSFLRFNLLSSGWTGTVCIFSTAYSTTKFFSGAPGEKVFLMVVLDGTHRNVFSFSPATMTTTTTTINKERLLFLLLLLVEPLDSLYRVDKLN